MVHIKKKKYTQYNLKNKYKVNKARKFQKNRKSRIRKQILQNQS